MGSGWLYNNFKKHTTIGYMREANYREKTIKPTLEQQGDTGEVTEISHEKLPPMPEKSITMLHHTFYLKHKTDLKDAKISEEHNKNYRL